MDIPTKLDDTEEDLRAYCEREGIVIVEPTDPDEDRARSKQAELAKSASPIISNIIPAPITTIGPTYNLSYMIKNPVVLPEYTRQQPILIRFAAAAKGTLQNHVPERLPASNPKNVPIQPVVFTQFPLSVQLQSVGQCAQNEGHQILPITTTALPTQSFMLINCTTTYQSFPVGYGIHVNTYSTKTRPSETGINRASTNTELLTCKQLTATAFNNRSSSQPIVDSTSRVNPVTPSHSNTYSPNRFKCSIPSCSMTFQNRQLLIDHISGHMFSNGKLPEETMNKKHQQCDEHIPCCQATTLPIVSISKSDTLRTGTDQINGSTGTAVAVKNLTRYYCPYPGCSLWCKKRRSVKQGVFMDHGTKSPLGDQKCDSEKILKQHKNNRQHSKNKFTKSYFCSYRDCGRTNKYKLKRHIRAHINKKIYVCRKPGCRLVLKNSYIAKRHSFIHLLRHGSNTSLLNINPQCKKPPSHSTHSSLLTKLNVNIEGQSPLPCQQRTKTPASTESVCDALTASTLTSGKNHPVMEGSNGLTKTLRCPMEHCTMTFHSRYNQLRHIGTHIGKDVLNCSVPGCSATFKHRDALRKHLVLHVIRGPNNVPGNLAAETLQYFDSEIQPNSFNPTTTSNVIAENRILSIQPILSERLPDQHAKQVFRTGNEPTLMNNKRQMSPLLPEKTSFSVLDHHSTGYLMEEMSILCTDTISSHSPDSPRNISSSSESLTPELLPSPIPKINGKLSGLVKVVHTPLAKQVLVSVLNMSDRTNTHYVCPFAGCRLKVTQASQLYEHICRHTGERPFKCQQCSANFVRLPDIRVHYEKHHPEETVVANGESGDFIEIDR